MENEQIKEVWESVKNLKYTIKKPEKEFCRSLQPGDRVLLSFINEKEDSTPFDNEKLLVKINEIISDEYIGVLIDNPCKIEGFKAGDKVAFREEHIYGQRIAYTDTEAIEIYDKRCRVSELVYIGDCLPVYMIREKPEDASDSGWILLDEPCYRDVHSTDHELIDSTLCVILNDDYSFVHLLNEPVGSVFSRNMDDGTWQRVK